MTTTTTPDRTLAEALHRGDLAAVKAAWARFGRPVTTLAFGVLGDGTLAGEAVLSSFVRMAATPTSFQNGVDPAPLVFAIARSEVTDRWQGASGARREAGSPDVGSSLGSIPIDAARAAWEIRTAIDELDQSEQELLKLVHFAGLSPSQIVEQLALSPNELTELSKEAHRRLASLLAHLDPDEQANLDRITELLRSEAMWANAGDGMATAIAATIKGSAAATADPAPVFDGDATPQDDAVDVDIARQSEGSDGLAHPLASDEPKVISTAPIAQPVGGSDGDGDGAYGTQPVGDRSPVFPVTEPAPATSRLAADPLDADVAPIWGGLEASGNGLPSTQPVAAPGSPTAIPGARQLETPTDLAAGSDGLMNDLVVFDGDPPTLEPGPTAGRAGNNGTKLLAVAAILVGLVMGLGTLYTMQRGTGDLTSRDLTLAGTELAPTGATASVLLVDAPGGVEVTMLIENLGAAPADTYFEGWVHTISDAQVSIGSFHLRRGETRVTGVAGVPLADLAEVSVTLEPIGGPPGPSGAVLVGTIGTTS